VGFDLDSHFLSHGFQADKNRIIPATLLFFVTPTGKNVLGTLLDIITAYLDGQNL
jgi:hypothetical protein